MNDDQKLSLGILAGLGAGLLWGLVFVAPQALSEFSPLEITYGRFFFFGLFSLLYIRSIGKIFTRLTWREILIVLGLSAAGFWLYTIGLVQSVQLNGGILTTLVIGLLPITISLAGAQTKLPWRFYMGLSIILLGLLVLELVPFLSAAQMVGHINIVGLLVLPGSLVMWTWYGIRNSSFLQAREWISKRDFTSLIGLVSLVCLSVIASVQIDFANLIHHADFSGFLIWSAVLGIGSTWLAYWLWNICSNLCTPQISGPLIIAETVCGVLFTFMYQQRLPDMTELIAIILFVSGACIAVMSQTKIKNSDV